jgi:hypothetical protein
MVVKEEVVRARLSVTSRSRSIPVPLDYGNRFRGAQVYEVAVTIGYLGDGKCAICRL